MQKDGLRSVLNITGALADRQRLRIIMLLQKGELCVCQIVEVLGLAPSTVSKHLSILYSAALVDSRKEGRWMYYRLPDDLRNERILAWLKSKLANDPAISSDANKLLEILKTDREELCRKQRK